MAGKGKNREVISAAPALCQLSPCVIPCALAVTGVLCNLLMCSVLWVCLLSTKNIHSYDKAGFHELPR